MFATVGQRAFSAGKQAVHKIGAMALLVSLLQGGEAAAQNYKTDPIKLSAKVAKAMQSKVITPSLRDLATFNLNKNKFTAYFEDYYFPLMTSTNKVALGKLAKLRVDLFKLFIRRTTIQEVQQHLTDITMAQMKKLAIGEFHPAVRYNAVLIIGTLDERYSGGGANPQPPVPLSAGTNVLLILLEQDTVGNVKIPISLKLGALKGLQRHARFGIDAKYAERLTQALLKLMAQQEPPEDVAQDVFHWLQCQAARVLVQQAAKAPSAEVQAALTAMIDNAEISLEDRCCVAGLLAGIEYGGAKGIDANATRLALGALTQAVFKDEATFAKDYLDELVGDNRFGGRGGLRRGSGRSGDDAGPRFERRRVMARLRDIVEGARSLDAALQPEEKQQLAELLSHIDSLMTKGGEKNSLDQEVAESVLQEIAEVNRLVESWQVADEPAAEKAAEDDFL